MVGVRWVIAAVLVLPAGVLRSDRCHRLQCRWQFCRRSSTGGWGLNGKHRVVREGEEGRGGRLGRSEGHPVRGQAGRPGVYPRYAKRVSDGLTVAKLIRHPGDCSERETLGPFDRAGSAAVRGLTKRPERTADACAAVATPTL